MIKIEKKNTGQRAVLTDIWPQSTQPLQVEVPERPPRIPRVTALTGQTRDRCSLS